MAIMWGFAPFLIHFPLLLLAWMMLGVCVLILWQATWRPLRPRKHTHPENLEIAPWMDPKARYAIAKAMNNGELIVAFVQNGVYHLMTLQQLEEGVHPNLHAIPMLGELSRHFYESYLTPSFIKYVYQESLRGKAAEIQPDIGIDQMVQEFINVCEPHSFPRLLNQFVNEVSTRLDRACQM